MPAIIQDTLPKEALLGRYADGDAYVDCYAMDVPRRVDLGGYIAAFYTSRVFKVERALLGLVARKPAGDDDARRLAADQAERFSAWTVEARGADQILLRCGRTRSWLMVAPPDGAAHGVRLYFGSAVLPKGRAAGGRPAFDFPVHALSGFHRWYTKTLMRSAYANLPATPEANLEKRVLRER